MPQARQVPTESETQSMLTVHTEGAPHASANWLRISPLIILILLVDLFVPFLIWKAGMPASFRWASHASVALMMALVFCRMMLYNRVPVVVLACIAVSSVSIFVALLRGQGLAPTVWGWWLMFQFPVVGLFAFLEPRWPENFGALLRRMCVAILVLELMVQVGQYLSGERPGDNLAGTFGRKGTSDLALVILLGLCIALGEWIQTRRWQTAAVILVTGCLCSVLGEVKFFLLSATLLALGAVAIYLLRSGKVWQVIPCLLLAVLAVIGFVKLYDQAVPGARDGTLAGFVSDPTALAKYLDFTRRWQVGGRSYYEVGRNTALQMGWEGIRNDPTTLLFGLGLGARGESVTLGTAGIGFGGTFGMTSKTSLLVMLQELGVAGVLAFAAMWLTLLVTLFRGTQEAAATPAEAELVQLRYALFLFTLFWPLWLWYTSAWTLRVPMLLYWVSLGFVLSHIRQKGRCCVVDTAPSGRASSGSPVGGPGTVLPRGTRLAWPAPTTNSARGVTPPQKALPGRQL
jgi:hypothetical protein